MKKIITPKQTEILLLIYRFRFLTRIHIQKFLNHKSDTRISSWLRDLTQKQIISNIYSKNLIIVNKPAIYYLSTKSRSIMKDNKDCNQKLLNRVYREKNRSDIFKNHWLFIADLYLFFQEVAQKQNSKLDFYTTTDLVDFAYLTIPLPDIYIAVKESKKVTKRYFLDCFDEKLPRFVMRKRIVTYFKYYKSNDWQKYIKHPFPKIMIICPNTFTNNFLSKFIIKTIVEEEVEIKFLLAIKPDIQKRGIQKDTWEII